MIVVFKKDANQNEIDALKKSLIDKGFHLHESQGENHYLIGLVGDTSIIDPGTLRAHSIVEKVVYVQEPYKKANRRFNPNDLIVDIEGHKIGGGFFTVIAGPCSVESEDQVVEIAKMVKASKAGFLRGGAFKPRTSPYSFQGMGVDGLELLLKAKKETGLPIVTEIMSISQLEKYHDMIDMVQIGARNMQNFDLLKEAGKIKKPVLIKRGMSATLEELLMSAEYVLAGGNENVILCERGIRSFQKETRNLLDLSAVPILKSKTHLPVIVDPSHATGIRSLVEPMSKAAIACGADGLMIEVHNDPDNALCDGDQSIRPEEFEDLMRKLEKYIELENKILN
jgi:3-deoxy-7-phosphoheptulonate synthase